MTGAANPHVTKAWTLLQQSMYSQDVSVQDFTGVKNLPGGAFHLFKSQFARWCVISLKVSVFMKLPLCQAVTIGSNSTTARCSATCSLPMHYAVVAVAVAVAMAVGTVALCWLGWVVCVFFLFVRFRCKLGLDAVQADRIITGGEDASRFAV